MAPHRSPPGGFPPRVGILLLAGIAVLATLGWRQLRRPPPSVVPAPATVRTGPTLPTPPAHAVPTRLLLPTPGQTNPAPEEVVAAKLAAFVRQQRELLPRYARHLGVAVPPEAAAFLDLAEEGSWVDLQEAYARLHTRREAGELPTATARLFPVLLETYGVLQVAHDWPAEALLDYGQAVQGALTPGTVYLAGTDPGRFIPTLLHPTGEANALILNPNTLADGSYLDYVRFLHRDRLAGLTAADSAEAFTSYATDAERRWQHDRDFPNEPRQVRVGEQIEVQEDGRVHVAGPVAVQSVNEALVHRLLEKNPRLAFVLEESHPILSLHDAAEPSGPLLQLQGKPAAVPSAGVDPGQPPAQRALDYWEATTDRLLDDPRVANVPEVRNAWARLCLAQAGWLADQEAMPAAETLFRQASRLAPGLSEVVFRHVEFLAAQDRWDEARRVAEAAVKAAPDQEAFRNLLESARAQRKTGAP